MDTVKLQTYRRIEGSLRKLLDSLPPTIAESDRREATEKIDHDEFAIALQVIGALILENEFTLDGASKRLMLELMEEMQMNQEGDEDYWFWEKMRRFLQTETGD
ncbi:hypothetical protein JM946_23370 [Steroidobacter sp. S1-65]|uniref:Uncharacterized protein n=1 Tax=Steroidobacter gossypii TaxID=2805490 RepID=A0ABS1X3A5_9GAMM|nr:hypothetical protein [Steroidobacter gossypii]MBM0107695.1 hypothetical protein [Steroidobacter gossypii]